MRRKQVLVIAVFLALAAGIIALLWLSRSESPQSKEPQTQADAIEQARNYEVPEGMTCGAVLTPAVHQATGARYTFPDACVAPGWEPER